MFEPLIKSPSFNRYIDDCLCENMDGERICDYCEAMNELDKEEQTTTSPTDLW